MAVGRDAGFHFDARGVRDLANCAVLDLHSENVVVQHRIGIGFAIRKKNNVCSVAAPIDRVLVMIAAGERARFASVRAHDENMRAPIVRKRGASFVQNARDYQEDPAPEDRDPSFPRMRSACRRATMPACCPHAEESCSSGDNRRLDLRFRSRYPAYRWLMYFHERR
jgi:hypothetical protein